MKRVLILVAVGFGLLLVPWIWGAAYAPKLNDLTNLKSQSIRKIEVFDRSGTTKLKTFTDAPSLAAFSQACRDVTSHAPNHPQYDASWYVVVDANLRYELRLNFEAGFPGVSGNIVLKRGGSTRYYGSFRSSRLRAWVENHVMTP